SETPMIIHSFSNFEYDLSGCGRFTLPCLSISHSTAPEKKKRVNARASFLVSGSFFNFSSRIFHSSNGYAIKHLTSPRVTINFSTRPSLKFAETITRPLASQILSYSHINIFFHHFLNI